LKGKRKAQRSLLLPGIEERGKEGGKEASLVPLTLWRMRKKKRRGEGSAEFDRSRIFLFSSDDRVTEKASEKKKKEREELYPQPPFEPLEKRKRQKDERSKPASIFYLLSSHVLKKKKKEKREGSYAPARKKRKRATPRHAPTLRFACSPAPLQRRGKGGVITRTASNRNAKKKEEGM